jgi:ribosomal protein L7/L12
MAIKRRLNPAKFPVGTVLLNVDMISTATIVAYSYDAKFVQISENGRTEWFNTRKDSAVFAGIISYPLKPESRSTPLTEPHPVAGLAFEAPTPEKSVEATGNPHDMLIVKVSKIHTHINPQIMSAIKAWREITGCDLADAKAHIQGETTTLWREQYDRLTKDGHLHKAGYRIDIREVKTAEV